MGEELFSELRLVEDTIQAARLQLEGLTERIEEIKRGIINEIVQHIEEARYTKFNPEALDDFLAEPYLVLPKRMEKGQAIEWYVVVPRIIDFQLGWLERSTRSYNIFIVNQYVKWFSDVPQELEQRFNLRPLPLQVVDGLLLTGDEHQEEAWQRYRRHLYQREGAGAIRIKKGSEFKLIAQILEDGCLPFAPQPVECEDLREPRTSIQLRDYQERAWNLFLKYGATGIYWPFGAGKSYFGCYALAAVKGPKLVVVPTRTLREQWNEYLQNHTTIKDEVRVETYHSFHKVKNDEYLLTCFDECQHLPANTFIRLATLKTKYRMGFSGSPYREDGRVNYIIALTGYPIGLAWEKFFELGIIRKPKVTVHIVKTLRDKLAKLRALLSQEFGRTLIFSDSLDLGERIANEHDLEFVSGQSTNRLETIRENETVVISRVIVHPKYRTIGLGVRLVQETLPLCGRQHVELIAVMAMYNPFAEHAGMRLIQKNGPHQTIQKAIENLRRLGFDPTLMYSKKYNLQQLQRLSEKEIQSLKEALLGVSRLYYKRLSRSSKPYLKKSEFASWLDEQSLEELARALKTLSVLNQTKAYLYWCRDWLKDEVDESE